ncbi:hypothetical protein GS399_05190 [Pedobacter sp. HMF7647]|uniref:Signal transduction histidine kinase internal region domain-containing protein n=1 Tax=Hufsiella arboris TaxID=2695275 RepID=A0A7K1Y8F0_9SPHI|nr:sensor histidine kinase [Hufsiella arboris]MXV50359.1 hypothetical protein [Hufsiella arboris]
MSSIKSGFTPPLSVHLAGWAALIVYEISMYYFVFSTFSSVSRYATYYGLNISLFYLHAYGLNLAFDQRKLPYLRAAGWVLAEILLYVVVNNLLDQLIYSKTGPVKFLDFKKNFISLPFFRGIYMMGLSTLCWAFVRMINYRKTAMEAERQSLISAKQNAELERNLALSQNAFLQQQINPHMLFNSLHFIQANISKQSTRLASEGVMLLADVMRYSLEGADPSGYTTLENEIEQVKNIISLSALHKDGRQYLDLDISGDFSSVKVLPLLLVTLTENVLKHGDLSDPRDPANIRISIDKNQQLSYISSNKKNEIHKPGYGLGIGNTLTRLETAYPGKYQFDTRQAGQYFHLTLKLSLLP